jgi:hypothetical protein
MVQGWSNKSNITPPDLENYICMHKRSFGFKNYELQLCRSRFQQSSLFDQLASRCGALRWTGNAQSGKHRDSRWRKTRFSSTRIMRRPDHSCPLTATPIRGQINGAV